ncbi:MAG: tyrosine protein kinase [Dysgonamonadaceae bacterium]|jgi:tRNA A-37 threonylcarbamoyl transferase component Bud32|nr:tyrosine protein kinase [Dysgonamonadaceae bacterium]
MKITIRSEYEFLRNFIERIPVDFSKKGESIYKARNELKLFSIEGVDLIVKSFKKPHFINKIMYSFFRSSKAERSYENALKIEEKGFNTPAPVAYIELYKKGMISGSYYVSLNCTFSRSFREFDLRPGTFNKKTDILLAFADFTAEIHEAGIYHQDYSNGNILFRKTNENIEFSLIDINRMFFGQVTEKMGGLAFSRLCAGEEMLKIIAQRYAEKRKFDINRFCRKVKYYNDKTMKPTPLDEWPPLENN